MKIIPTGKYTVTISKEGFETQVHDVFVPEATPLNVLWVLQAQGNQFPAAVSTQPATTSVPSTHPPNTQAAASSNPQSSNAPGASQAASAITSNSPTSQPTTTLSIGQSGEAYSGSIFGWFLVILVVVR